MRREWIDEGKPRSSFREDTRHTPSIVTENKPSQSAQSNSEQKEQRSESGTFADTSTPRLQQRPHTPPGEIRQADDDLYNVTPGAVRKTVVQGHGSNDDGLFVAASSPGAQPEEDELDILLAEETHAGQGSGNQSLSIESPAADNFDDEMEAMADMDNMW